MADRNLLFGILALQLDFISKEQLISGMNAWILTKEQQIADILQQAGALSTDNRAILEAVVKAHLRHHRDNVQASLAAVSSIGSMRDELSQLADPDVTASIPHISSAHRDQPQFQTLTAGESTSMGARFRVLRPHAEGGLGKVFVARDAELNREVALKEIQPRYADNPAARARFMLEAEVTGGLEHPCIVPVYGLGTYPDGRPFYAMRFIRGDSLKDAIDRYHDPQSNKDASPSNRVVQLRQLLARFVDVCQAIQYAHDRGVLHRDLKPGNIMLGKYGETLVVDWGLAKARGKQTVDSTPLDCEIELQPVSGSAVEPTAMGSLVGTLQYMSPEQAAGRLDLVGPGTDVFALGATLFHLLTGKPPYFKSSRESLVADVQNARFDPPRNLNPGIPKPLESICLKAMSRSLDERYASAAELFADVERWLADEPVSAHRESKTEHILRWRRKHPRLNAALAATLLIGVVSVSITAVILNQKNALLAQANAAAVDSAAKANAATMRAEQQRQIATSNQLAIESRELRSRDPWGALSKAIAAVDATVQFGDDMTNVAETELRSALRHCGGEAMPQVPFNVVSPGNRWISRCVGSTTYLWDTRAEDLVGSCQLLRSSSSTAEESAFSADDRHLAIAARDGTVFVWRLSTVAGPAKLRHTVPKACKTLQEGVVYLELFNSPLQHLAISGDGRTLATVDDTNTTSIWNLGQEITKHTDTVFEEAGPCRRFTISPDSKILTSLCNRGVVITRLLPNSPLNSGSHQFLEQPDVSSVLFTLDSKKLIIVTRREALIYDLTTGSIEEPLQRIAQLQNPVIAISSGDSKQLIIGYSDGNLIAWPLLSGDAKPKYFKGHTRTVQAITRCDANGNFATSSNDHTIKLWNLREGGGEELRGNSVEISSLCLVPGSNRLLGSSYGRAQIWELSGKNQEPMILGSDAWKASNAVSNDDWHTVFSGTVALSGDGRNLFCDIPNPTRVWGDDFELSDRTSENSFGLRKTAFSADGKWMASLFSKHIGVHQCLEKSVAWNAIKIDLANVAPESAIGMSPDGRWVAASVHESVLLWDLHSADPNSSAKELPNHNATATAILFPPQGDSLITVGKDRKIRHFSIKQNNQLTCEHIWDAKVDTYHAFMDPTGKYLATFGMNDSSIRIWDIENYLPEPQIASTGADCACLTFTADGESLIGGGRDGEIRIWDLTEKLKIKRRWNYLENASPDSMAVSHDQRHVFVGYGTDVRAWDLTTPVDEQLPRSVVLRHEGIVERISITPDDRWIITYDGQVKRWRWKKEELLARAKLEWSRAQGFANLQKPRLVASEAAVGSWSPDSKELVYDVGRTKQVVIQNLATGNTQLLAENGKDARWSPGIGKWITFVRATDNGEEIWVAERSGQNARRIAAGGFPQWMQDGHTLSFRLTRDNVTHIYTVDVDAPENAPQSIYESPAPYPALSPDGTKVVVARNQFLSIERVSDGSKIATLPIYGWIGVLPLWSRDGKYVVAGSYCTGGVEGMWLVDVERLLVSRLAEGKFTMGEISPDGKKIVYDNRASPTGMWIADLSIAGSESAVQTSTSEFFRIYPGEPPVFEAPSARDILAELQTTESGWELGDSILRGTATGKLIHPLLDDVSGSYRLSLEFQRHAGSGDINVIFPVGDRSLMALLKEESISFDQIGNQGVTKPCNLPTGLIHELIVHVTLLNENRCRIVLELNGDTALEYEGTQKSLNLREMWDIRKSHTISLGLFKSTAEFQNVRLTRL